MAAIYKFKTQEVGIDDLTRTIIKVKEVPVSIQNIEFKLEDKIKELNDSKESLINMQKRIDELELEIIEIKSQLNIE